MAAAPTMEPRNDPEPARAEGDDTNLETAEEEGPTLAGLQGDRNSVVMRRLMRGFFVSLDRPIRRAARRYWRTQSNGFVPYNRIVRREGSEFQGTVFPAFETLAAAGDAANQEAEEPAADDEAEPAAEEPAEAEEAAEPAEDAPFVAPENFSLPYGWVLSSRVRSYQRSDNGRFRSARGRIEYHDGHPLGEEVENGRHTYVRATDEENRWFRMRDLRIARSQEPPSDVQPNDKWLDVNLENQTIVAYQGRVPVYGTLISSGRADRANRPDQDWETLSGLFRVKSKHLTDTMDGDTAVDGPYSVDDVPYVMYFELAYAIHTAFWHNGFGHPRSHGCVNLAPLDARWIFNWADPPLPEGWHSAYPTDEVPGTWIYVHGETVGRR